ncbi:DUF6069 family protein [Rhodococcus artemisiae]|uniref:DUF6069 family protein n=1 Tax=Rhodococcus artemisiae TaxID=714159 RepID=A0ABU7L787_9NOCA|nr:DUF6069 family protein [Rhodococcus artemisiae]MEE2056772.1 DUF6069 family protein [Rhodococcus artemisiae]
MSQYNPDPATNAVDVKKLWSGGLATAVVAALAAVVGLLVIRELLDVPVITPEILFGRSQAANLAVFAAIAALVATGLLHLLILSTPRATSFFSWICTLATVAVALWPFMFDATLASKVCSAVLYLVVGTAIVSLLSGVARSAAISRPIGR